MSKHDYFNTPQQTVPFSLSIKTKFTFNQASKIKVPRSFQIYNQKIKMKPNNNNKKPLRFQPRYTCIQYETLNPFLTSFLKNIPKNFRYFLYTKISLQITQIK